MTKDKLTRVVLKTISRQLGIPIQKVELSSHIFNDLMADSLNQVEICMDLEEYLNICLDDDEFERSLIVRDIVNLTYKECQ